jgi:hypothetical protein
MQNKLEIVPLLWKAYHYIDTANGPNGDTLFFSTRATDLYNIAKMLDLDVNEFKDIETCKDETVIKMLGLNLAYSLIKLHVYI